MHILLTDVCNACKDGLLFQFSFHGCGLTQLQNVTCTVTVMCGCSTCRREEGMREMGKLAFSLVKSEQERVTRVRACNYVKIEIGQNFLPVLK